jgi:hypothetical protein
VHHRFLLLQLVPTHIAAQSLILLCWCVVRNPLLLANVVCVCVCLCVAGVLLGWGGVQVSSTPPPQHIANIKLSQSPPHIMCMHANGDSSRCKLLRQGEAKPSAGEGGDA